jgi:hypothetical protein
MKKELFLTSDKLDGFKINKDFAKKFEHRKQREHLDYARQTMGKDFDSINIIQ